MRDFRRARGRRNSNVPDQACSRHRIWRAEPHRLADSRGSRAPGRRPRRRGASRRTMTDAPVFLCLILAFVGCAYLVYAAIVAARFATEAAPEATVSTPVTILKPLN